MRVLHYVPILDRRRGGVVSVVIDICNWLHAEGIDCSIATFENRESDSLPETTKVHLITKQQIASLKKTKRFHFDWPNFSAFHAHGFWDLTALRLSRLFRKNGTKTILSPHGMLDHWSVKQKWIKKTLFLRLFGRQYNNSFEQFHCTALAEAEQLATNLGVRPDRITSIPCPIDLDRFRNSSWQPRIATSKRPLKILFLSRIHIKKGLEFLIDATSEIDKAKVNFELTIAGPGEDKYVKHLEERCKIKGVFRKTKFIGMVSGIDKTELYRSHDIFVLPTYQENFGLVLVEALASGCAVITTRNTDIWPELEKCGGIICDQNPQAIAKAIMNIGESSNHIDLPNVLKRLEDWLGKEKTIKKYIKMYEPRSPKLIAKQKG